MVLAFLFIGLVPYTKLWHIFTGMIGYFSRDFKPSANRMVYHLEEAEHFGVENIEEFTWKDLLDLTPVSAVVVARKIVQLIIPAKPLILKLPLFSHEKTS